MRLDYLLLSLLPVVLCLGSQPSAEVVSLADAYQNAADSTIEALSGYDGGIGGLPGLIYALYSTRSTVRMLNDHMDRHEKYTAADSALIRNRTVEATSSLVHALNIGRLKLPLAREAGGQAITREFVRRFHEQDTRVVNGIVERMTPEDQEESREAFQGVVDAYNAVLEAA